ncbi:hypothetical protein GCM10009654_42120 [Streptomyces hebeiensis]|uniref:Mersacidin/lichenicidin family type 2 lantibiotic n=1 Tax=Streptomyces hebeiensis TaxID=229486 RepID=A0ABN1UY14_9ACTN
MSLEFTTDILEAWCRPEDAARVRGDGAARVRGEGARRTYAEQALPGYSAVLAMNCTSYKPNC